MPDAVFVGGEVQQVHDGATSARRDPAPSRDVGFWLNAPTPDAALALPAALKALPEMAWCATADGQQTLFNDRWCAFTGTGNAMLPGHDWTCAVHSNDRAEARSRWCSSIRCGAAFDMTLRLCGADGGLRWVQARAAAVRNSDGVVTQWIGTAADIDAIKAGADRAALVAGELAHRIGNIFGVVGSVLALSARDRPEAADFASNSRARIKALSEVHDFIWPLSTAAEAVPPQAQAQALIRLLLRPYEQAAGPHIDISGSDDAIGTALASSVALIVHELATNAVKYGSLSRPEGRLAIRLRSTSTQLFVLWSETGGPVIDHPPTRHGFGTALIDKVTKLGQASSVRRRWRPGGLTTMLRFDLQSGSRTSPAFVTPLPA